MRKLLQSFEKWVNVWLKSMSTFLHREDFRKVRNLGFFFNKAPTVKVKYLLRFVGIDQVSERRI